MLLKPPANCNNGPFVGVRRRVGSVKYADLGEQYNCDATPFAFANLCAEFDEQCLDVFPGNVGARGVSVDRLEGTLVSAFHRPDGST